METVTREAPAERVARSPFAERPRLVFWETTRACALACRHCRAEAQLAPLPDELTTAEAERLLEDIHGFGTPAPVVIFTGGDPLQREDLWLLLEYAAFYRLPMAVSPAVTPRLDGPTLQRLADYGVHACSVSIDADREAHDDLRGVPGTYDRSLLALRAGAAAGLQMQVNTVVMRHTVADLPKVAAMLLREGVRTWEVFFLVATGRALAAQQLPPEDIEDVCRFLLDATRYGLTVRTVEAPFIRRVQAQSADGGALYHRLTERLAGLVGEPPQPATATGAGPRHAVAPRGTLDGDGILFVAYDGRIMPGGLMPLALGNVRHDSLVATYRDSPLLQDIRARHLRGACGACAWRQVCGGSRARSLAATGDPLGSDPACLMAAAASA
jgi:radical SAM protein